MLPYEIALDEWIEQAKCRLQAATREDDLTLVSFLRCAIAYGNHLKDLQSRLAALESRLAVLGKVEEEVKKHGEIRFAEFSDGFFVILQERSSDPFQCEAFGNSFLEAFAALVDGKDGG